MKIKASHTLSMVVLTITLLVVLTPTTTLAQKVLPVQGPEVVVQPDQPPASRSPGCCVCPSGSYYNAQRASCIKLVCANVKGLPDGDKGGGFFSYHGSLWQNQACLPAPDLDLTAATGQPGWKVSGPGAGPTPVSVGRYFTAWDTPIAGSSWVSINSNSGSPPAAAADYKYTYEFCLCDKAEAPQLTAWLLADNCVTSVDLNGHPGSVPQSGTPTMSSSCPYGFTKGPYPYGTSNPAFFQAGTNIITITVHNNGSVTGLDAELHITAKHGQCPGKIRSEGL